MGGVPSLILRHLPDPEQVRFAVLRSPAGAIREAVVPAAHRHPVPGRPDSFLVSELHWYLERFLDYPFPPATVRAERVLAALRDWGEAAFTALFDQGLGAPAETFDLHIESDDATILAWPWEALGSRETGPLGTAIRMARGLETLPLEAASAELPADRLNVLLVIARNGANDVAYRSVARPIVELAAELPIRVHVLRPPTLEALRAHLRQRPGTYHVLHFDGHGDITLLAGRRAAGRLVFEDDEGRPHPVVGRCLAEVLAEHPVPLVVLNACRSAELDVRMRDPFAMVAAALLASRIGSVVAMSSELNVAGARTLLPVFYRSLCMSGDPSAALLAGRRQMAEYPERLSPRGKFPLADWLVPVLYQRLGATPALPLLARSQASGVTPNRSASERIFLGRDGAVLWAERLLRRPPYAIWIHGLAGVGKTAFARVLAAWLLATQGVEEVHWCAGGDLAQLEQTLAQHRGDSRGRRRLLVIDSVDALAPRDLEVLSGLVSGLRSQGAPLVITSRGDLAGANGTIPSLLLDGLPKEEAWDLCDQIAGEASPIVRNLPSMELWMDLVGGHPQAFWALVPEIVRRGISFPLDDLRGGAFAAWAEAVGSGPAEDLAALLAPLQGLAEGVEESRISLLLLVALHEGFVHVGTMAEMMRERGAPCPRPEIAGFLEDLVSKGLMSPRGSEIFAIHPALPGFLRVRLLPAVTAPEKDALARAFTSIMAALAYQLTPLPFHRQDQVLAQNKSSFRSALEWAQRLDAKVDEMALLHWMAVYSHQHRQFDVATTLLLRLFELNSSTGERADDSAFLHRLGMVAQEEGALDRAAEWYRQALQIDEDLGDTVGAARTCHQLGMLARDRQDFAGAEVWLRRALATFEAENLKSNTMATCLQLGELAQARGNLEEAAAWYERGRLLVTEGDDEHILARFEHQLSAVALLRGSLREARRWELQSLHRKLRLRDQQGKASGYHQLGLIAQEDGDLDAAEKYFQRSLMLSEELGQRTAMANSYHHLGVISQLQNDPGGARRWFRRSLDLAKDADDVDTANTHHHLGMVAQDLGELDEAELQYRTTLRLIDRSGNERQAVPSLVQLGLLSAERGSPKEAEEHFRAALAKARKVGDEIGVARAWYRLGEQAEARGDLDAAASAYRELLELAEKRQLDDVSAMAYTRLAKLALRQGDDEESFVSLLQAIRFATRIADRKQVDGLRRWLRNFYRHAQVDQERLHELAAQADLATWLDEE